MQCLSNDVWRIVYRYLHVHNIQKLNAEFVSVIHPQESCHIETKYGRMMNDREQTIKFGPKGVTMKWRNPGRTPRSNYIRHHSFAALTTKMRCYETKYALPKNY